MRPVDCPANIVAKCELAGQALRAFGSLRFAATGWSMLPCVFPGETLVVERVAPRQVHVGDVVLVGREGTLCAHRVIALAGDADNPRWITQGDALPVPDRPVAANDLLGRVNYLLRAGNLIAVPSELSVVESLIARVVRRSAPAARALVYLHSKVQVPRESVLPCQG